MISNTRLMSEAEATNLVASFNASHLLKGSEEQVFDKSIDSVWYEMCMSAFKGNNPLKLTVSKVEYIKLIKYTSDISVYNYSMWSVDKTERKIHMMCGLSYPSNPTVVNLCGANYSSDVELSVGTGFMWPAFFTVNSVSNFAAGSFVLEAIAVGKQLM